MLELGYLIVFAIVCVMIYAAFRFVIDTCKWFIAMWLDKEIKRLRQERITLLMKRREFRNMGRQLREEAKCSEQLSDSSTSSA
jgi:hypothetical protein